MCHSWGGSFKGQCAIPLSEWSWKRGLRWSLHQHGSLTRVGQALLLRPLWTCSYVTNDLKLRSLEDWHVVFQKHLLSHNFCGSGILSQLSWVPLPQVSHKTAVKVLSRAAVSSEGLMGKQLASKLIHVVIGKIQLLTGFRTSAACWLLVGDLPQFLAIWASP